MISGWVKFTYSDEMQARHVAAWPVSSSKAFTVEPYPDDEWVFHVKQEWAANMPPPKPREPK